MMPAVQTEATDAGWRLLCPGILTDEQASALTVIARPDEVEPGQFVEVADMAGVRIGHLSVITYHPGRLNQQPYVVCSVSLS